MAHIFQWWVTGTPRGPAAGFLAPKCVLECRNLFFSTPMLFPCIQRKCSSGFQPSKYFVRPYFLSKSTKSLSNNSKLFFNNITNRYCFQYPKKFEAKSRCFPHPGINFFAQTGFCCIQTLRTGGVAEYEGGRCWQTSNWNLFFWHWFWCHFSTKQNRNNEQKTNRIYKQDHNNKQEFKQRIQTRTRTRTKRRRRRTITKTRTSLEQEQEQQQTTNIKHQTTNNRQPTTDNKQQITISLSQLK